MNRRACSLAVVALVLRTAGPVGAAGDAGDAARREHLRIESATWHWIQQGRRYVERPFAAEVVVSVLVDAPLRPVAVRVRGECHPVAEHSDRALRRAREHRPLTVKGERLRIGRDGDFVFAGRGTCPSLPGRDALFYRSGRKTLAIPLTFQHGEDERGLVP